jgi:hypothetical protein
VLHGYVTEIIGKTDQTRAREIAFIAPQALENASYAGDRTV